MKIAYDADFGNLVNSQISLEKSLFFLDAWKLEKRKYTKLRQLLITDLVHFPAYNKVVELRSELILKFTIQFYPNPSNPIGVYYPYRVFVQHTLERVLTTFSNPKIHNFPHVFQISNRLDGSGSIVIYNQEKTNTATKNFILFALNPSQFVQILVRSYGRMISQFLI